VLIPACTVTSITKSSENLTRYILIPSHIKQRHQYFWLMWRKTSLMLVCFLRCDSSTENRRFRLYFAWTSIFTGKQVVGVYCWCKVKLQVVLDNCFFSSMLYSHKYSFKLCSHIVQLFVSKVIGAAVARLEVWGVWRVVGKNNVETKC
jgi:hypothetical protein